MLAYALVYLSSVLVDCIPVFAPPAWMLMILIMLKFDLNPWIVALVGTAGTVSGRLIFVTYVIPWLGSKTIGSAKEEDLKYLGKKLSNKSVLTFFFILLYSILPLSTTALFTAAGLSKLRKILIIPPFFLGNLIGDGALLISGKYAIHNLSDLYKGSLDPKSIALSAFGLLFVLSFLFIDWRELIQNKKLKFKWKFWK
jgi:membrane protein YqaA with SNARE-associated domain